MQAMVRRTPERRNVRPSRPAVGTRRAAQATFGGLQHDLPEVRLVGLFAAFDALGQRASHNARIGLFSVADLAGLVDLFAGEADVLSGWFGVPVWNAYSPPVVLGRGLSSFLSRVILIRQPLLGLAPDDEQTLSG